MSVSSIHNMGYNKLQTLQQLQQLIDEEISTQIDKRELAGLSRNTSEVKKAEENLRRLLLADAALTTNFKYNQREH